MVFPKPFDMPNPSMTLGRQIIRALEIFGVGRRVAEGRERMLATARPGETAARILRPDATVQAAVTDLLIEIQRQQKTTLLFISHDRSVMRYLSDRVMMYLGHVVEPGSTDQVFSPPYPPIPRRCYRWCRSPILRSRRPISRWRMTCLQP